MYVSRDACVVGFDRRRRHAFFRGLVGVGLLVLSASVWAATSCPVQFNWRGNSVGGGQDQIGGASLVCSLYNGSTNNGTFIVTDTYTPDTGTPDTPTVAGQNGGCTDNQVRTTIATGVQTPSTTTDAKGLVGVMAAGTTCPTTSCPALGTAQSYSAPIPAPATGSTVCINQCGFTYNGYTASVDKAGAIVAAAESASSTGASCGSPASPTTAGVVPGGSCVSSGGKTTCLDTSSGKNCGTFNGDQVCPASIPPGTCQSFASGGVACTGSPAGSKTIATPPAPNSGTSGTPAVPDGHVDTTLGGLVVNTTNYYSATTVAVSTAVTVTAPGGANVGNGGTATTAPLGSGGDGKGNAGTECGNGMTSTGTAGGCTGSSASGGIDCTSPPVCNGDPVQCRILFETWASRCETLPAREQLLVGMGLSDGTGPTGQVIGLNPTAASSEDIKAVFLAGDTGGWLSRSCPADMPVSLGDYGSVIIPLSDKCQYFQLFGTLVLITGYLVSARIIVEGF